MSRQKFEASQLGQSEQPKAAEVEITIEREPVTEHEARQIMGDQMFGSGEVFQVFNFPIEQAPPIPFSREELSYAAAQGQQLILQVDHSVVTEHGGLSMAFGRKVKESITCETLLMRHKTTKAGLRMFDKGVKQYKKIPEFKRDIPDTCWKLVDTDVHARMMNNDYFRNIKALVAHVQEHPFLNKRADIKEALEEYRQQLPDLNNLLLTDSEWHGLAPKLLNLKITQLCQESAVELLYRLVLTNQARGTQLYRHELIWTNTPGGSGILVAGAFDKEGIAMTSHAPYMPATALAGVLAYRG